MIEIAIPGGNRLHLANALLDFNGTLALDGRLIEGVAKRLRTLAALMELHVVTGDTTGTAARELAGLPVHLHVMPPEGQDLAKRSALAALTQAQTVAVVIERARLSIVVVGREGCAAQTLMQADIVCSSIADALDLLLAPQRIVATLRR